MLKKLSFLILAFIIGALCASAYFLYKGHVTSMVRDAYELQSKLVYQGLLLQELAKNCDSEYFVSHQESQDNLLTMYSDLLENIDHEMLFGDPSDFIEYHSDFIARSRHSLGETRDKYELCRENI